MGRSLLTEASANAGVSAGVGCPLCLSHRPLPFHQDARRDYFRCTRCGLVFVPPSQFPSPAQERAQYELHQNDPADGRYRAFLSRLFVPLQSQLPAGAEGLDFGCGPGPTLSLMFEEAGHRMAVYDTFFAPHKQVLHRRYDFVTASEVVEHLHRPREELSRLWSLLKPGGWLGIMTKRVRDAGAFAAWHYRHDPTHVIFFATETFEWLAKEWTADLFVEGPDVVLLRKPGIEREDRRQW